MRYIILFCFCVLFSQVLNSQQHNTLLPAPRNISYYEGRLALKDISVYVAPDAAPDVKFALQELVAGFEKQTGILIKKAASPAGASLKYYVKEKGFLLPETTNNFNSNHREAYTIKINKSTVTINANTSTGLYYAIQTLKQMVEKNDAVASLPFADVQDEPALPYRGVMMDFAHGGLLTVEEIKRQIDFLATWKTNQYYFYNEVSIALNGYEGLNYKQGYSQAAIKEIVLYGKQRHVDVIPFIAFYGHLHDMLKHEKYASLAVGKYGHEVDPRKAETPALLKDWIKQYAELFTSPFIHVGFDETWETNRLATEGDSSIHSEALWLKHLIDIRQELKKYNKTVLAWTDMSSYYPDILSKFPQDVIPVIWEYSPDSAAIYHYLDPVLKSGRKFFIQPAVSGWGHIYPATAYTYENIDLCLKTGMKEGTLGFITSVWTDAVEPLVRPSWPFMAYGCIAAWQGTSPGRDSFEQGYSAILFPKAADEIKRACNDMAEAVELLQKCFGKNTSNMPGGTIIESWSNPFDEYYLNITKANTQTLKNVRLKCEEAEELLLKAMAKSGAGDQSFIESLRVTAKLMHYEASRFLWANVICERWDNAMLTTKKNNFVFYDIGYICHGLIQDMMDEEGSLKDDYAHAWLAESMPYRLNTMLGRFDVEYGLWQKLLLKVIDHRIKHDKDYVAHKSFAELFKPDF